MKAPADCQRCGVCCFSQLDTYVWVQGADWADLGPDADRLAHFIENRAFMKMRDGHCAALEVRNASAGQPEFFCTIYDRRPQICRDLARGSPECLGELASKAARVTAACAGGAAPPR